MQGRNSFSCLHFDWWYITNSGIYHCWAWLHWGHILTGLSHLPSLGYIAGHILAQWVSGGGGHMAGLATQPDISWFDLVTLGDIPWLGSAILLGTSWWGSITLGDITWLSSATLRNTSWLGSSPLVDTSWLGMLANSWLGSVTLGDTTLWLSSATMAQLSTTWFNSK
jgi:hypothetical protein